MNRLKLAFLLNLGGCLCYSIVSCLSYSLETRLSLPQIIFFQKAVGLLALIPLLIHQKCSLKTPCLSLHLIRDLGSLSATFFWLLSVKSLYFFNAAILQFTNPFYIPYLGWLWYREPIPRGIWKATLLGFIGVAVILRPNAGIMQEGALWGILTGVAAAIGLTALRRLTLKGEPAIRTMFYLFLTTSLISGPFAFAQWVPPSSNELALLFLLGISFFFNNILLTLSFRYASASYLAPLSYMTVIFNGCFGWFFFQKGIDLPTLLGGILILTGSSLIFFLKDKEPSSTVKA